MDVKPKGIKPKQSTNRAVTEPWELRAECKRDGEPHRAALLTGLAWISNRAAWLYVSIFPVLLIIPIVLLEYKKDRHDPLKVCYSLLCLIPPLMAIGSALLTRRMAAHDMKRMWTGDMDRRALPATRKAWSRSRTAIWITLLGPLGWVAAGALLYVNFVVSVVGPKTLIKNGFTDLAPPTRVTVGVLLYALFLVSIFGSITLIRRWFSKAPPNRAIP